MDAPKLREMATDALVYWEPRRLLYNLLLAAVVMAYFFAAWPDSMKLVTFFGQLSQFREQRSAWRFVVLLVGFAFAATITRFFALGFFPSHS